MNRRLVRLGIAVFALALVAGCTRDQQKPAASATPAAVKMATPAPQAAKPAGEEAAAEELYVDVEAEPDEGSPPLTVTFTSSVEDATPPLTYTWDFGDGSPPGKDANPTHVYQKEGEYTATVTIKDSKGISGSEEVDVLVEEE